MERQKFFELLAHKFDELYDELCKMIVEPIPCQIDIDYHKGTIVIKVELEGDNIEFKKEVGK